MTIESWLSCLEMNRTPSRYHEKGYFGLRHWWIGWHWSTRRCCSLALLSGGFGCRCHRGPFTHLLSRNKSITRIPFLVLFLDLCCSLSPNLLLVLRHYPPHLSYHLANIILMMIGNEAIIVSVWTEEHECVHWTLDIVFLLALRRRGRTRGYVGYGIDRWCCIPWYTLLKSNTKWRLSGTYEWSGWQQHESCWCYEG